MTVDIKEAAALLANARRHGRRIHLAEPLRPGDVRSSYAIQDEITALLGERVRGWKVGAPDSRTEPSAAPIYSVLASGSRIAAHRLHMIGVEAELAFVFGRDLAPRPAPFTRDEVLDAVAELRVAIEVCDSRLDDWQTASDLTKLADHQLNFALILGDATPHFRDLDYRSLDVRTSVDGAILKAGRGCHALDDPTRLLAWLIDHATRRGAVPAGTAVTTGSWLGMHFVQPGARVEVEFPALGRATVEFPR